jgi:hypothetical protein
MIYTSTLFRAAKFVTSATARAGFSTTMASSIKSPLFTQQVIGAMRTL